MLKRKLVALLTGGAVVGAVVVASLNIDGIKEVDAKFDETKTTIENYENNEKELVNKYNSLNEDAKGKIETANKLLAEKNKLIAEKEEKIKELEAINGSNSTEIENLKSEINNLKEQVKVLEDDISNILAGNSDLTNKIDMANKEIEKANEAIDYFNGKIGEINNSATPLTEGELNELTGKVSSDIVDVMPELPNEVAIAQDLNANFYNENISLTFKLNSDINIGLLNKGNVIIKYIGEDGKVIKTKNKTWSGYLNDSNGGKYGKGSENVNEYSNDLSSGTYSTTLNGAIANDVQSIELTVINDSGQKIKLTTNR